MDFRLFTQDDYEQTLAKWSGEADQYDCFPFEVEQKMQFVKEYLNNTADEQHKTLAYGVFKPQTNVAACLCTLVLSDRGALAGKWLKLLNIVLSPEISTLLEAEDFDATQSAVNAYKAAVMGAFSARLDHDADTLKLYGRNDEQLKFLMTLLAVLQQDEQSNINAKRDGRWLVITTRTR